MATVTRVIDVPGEDLFAALSDPRTYPHWLVGARDIRAVDDGWPAAGAAFHHRVGLVGPLKVADKTVVLDVDEPRHLSLEARAMPFGRAQVTYDVGSVDGKRGAACTVTMSERPLGWAAPLGGLLDPLLRWRNERSLSQLADYLQNGRSHRAPG